MRALAAGLAIQFLFCAAGRAQELPPPPFPMIENDRVRIWLNNAPPTKSAMDAVNVFTIGNSAGANFVLRQAPVSLVLGAAMITGEPPVPAASPKTYALYVELKNTVVASISNNSGYPNAFPRPGSRQLLDNARVSVWEYRWQPGEPTPMHFHDKDVVVLYLEDGTLTSTTPSGEKTVNEYKAGQVKFNPRDRVHTETLMTGTQRALMVELK